MWHIWHADHWSWCWPRSDEPDKIQKSKYHLLPLLARVRVIDISEHVTCLEIVRRLVMTFNPPGLDVAIGKERHLHIMAAFDDFQTSVGHVHLVDSGENGQMVGNFDARITIRINMRRKATWRLFVRDSNSTGQSSDKRHTTSSKLVVDLLLE